MTKKNIIYEKSFGYRDRANKISNNINTKFGIASGTKFFTALGIMKLIDEYKLDFHSKALDIIDFNFVDYLKDITIYQLLNHISGMPDYYDEDEIEGILELDKPWYKFYEPSDYFPFFPKKKMLSNDFKYNNGGYVLLAGIISKISGRPYSEYIEDEIFIKNNMFDSGFYPLNELPENTAFGYVGDDNSLKTNVYNLPIIGGGDGGAFTTAKDINILWLRFLNGDIISDYLVKKYFSEYVKVNDKTGYNSGVWINTDKDVRYFEGCDIGISFVSILDRDNETAYNVLSNTEYGAWEIKRCIIDSL